MQRNVVMPHSPRGQTAFPIEAPGLQFFGVIMLEMFWPELAHSYGAHARSKVLADNMFIALNRAWRQVWPGAGI